MSIPGTICVILGLYCYWFYRTKEGDNKS